MKVQSINNAKSFGRLAGTEKSLTEIKREERIANYTDKLAQGMKQGRISISEVYDRYCRAQSTGKRNLEKSIKEAILKLLK